MPNNLGDEAVGVLGMSFSGLLFLCWEKSASEANTSVLDYVSGKMFGSVDVVHSMLVRSSAAARTTCSRVVVGILKL